MRKVPSASSGPISPLRQPIRTPNPITTMMPRSTRFMAALSPMPPNNSTGAVKAHDRDEPFQGLEVALADLDAAAGQSRRRGEGVKHQGVERLHLHEKDHIRIPHRALPGGQATAGNPDLEGEIADAELVGLGDSCRRLGVEDSAH